VHQTHPLTSLYRSVLRRLVLHDFEKARAAGAAVGPDDGRAQPILELARTLRLLLGVADVAGAAVTSHVGLLLQQVQTPPAGLPPLLFSASHPDLTLASLVAPTAHRLVVRV
jgi:hypothetical protein